MKTETSILLPAATVDLFVRDAETIEAAKALQSDWRFARVHIRVQGGGVEEAIRIYAQSGSPEIILIETDKADDAFIAKLGDLSSHCAETTSAIVIGPVNDVNLYRKLTAMGVSDYLVRPVPQETLADVIAHGLIEKLGTGGSRLIALIGAKGGVGTSALSIAMAHASSETLGQKTFLFDAAGAWGSLGVNMGFEPVASTAEALKACLTRDADSFKRMQYVAGDKLRVLATGMEQMLDVPAHVAQFEDVLNTAMASFPVVVADLSSAPASVRKAVLTRAHQIVLVSSPTLSSLRAARALMNEIKMLQGGQGDNIDLVINMEGIAPGKEVSANDIKSALDKVPSAVIPFDPKIFIGAESEGRAVGADKAGADVVRKLMPILKKIAVKEPLGAQSDAGKEGLINSLLGKIKPKGK